MSDLLGNLEAYIRGLPRAEVRVVIGKSPLTDEMPMRSDVETNQADRELAESEIRPIDVGGASPGRFTCFMDGMQRPRGPIYINCPVPIVYGYVSAAVRTRGADRKMRTLQGFHEVKEDLFFSTKLAKKHGLTLAGVDTEDDKEPTIEHPLALIEAAHRKINSARSKLEDRLAARWQREHDQPDEWLLLDGALQSDYGENANIVGVTKSHGTQYLTWNEQMVVLGLKVGQRSGAFVPIVNDRRKPVYSWYLRMHDSAGKDPYFGLIRIEAPKDARVLGMIDTLSQWLLAERAPLALPDSRWDKMIYPIRDCEQYMKSLAPSHTTLDARLMRLGTLKAS